MPRRFGFWALLVVSTVWAQGCAHTPIESANSSLNELHNKLQGNWKCHIAFDDPPVFVIADSILVISENQMIEKGLGKFEIKDSNQQGYTTSEVETKQNYVLIDNQNYSYTPTAFRSKIIESSNNSVGNILIQIEQNVNKEILQKIHDKTEKKERFLLTNDNSLTLFGTEPKPSDAPQTCTRIQKP